MILSFIYFLIHIHADIGSCPSNIELANEMTRYKLSGPQVYKASKCLKQKDYKYLKVDSTFTGEESEDQIKSVSSYEIKEVKEVTTDFGKEIFVSVVLKLDTSTQVRETYSFIRLDQSPNKAEFGCAMTGSKDFEAAYLLASCR